STRPPYPTPSRSLVDEQHFVPRLSAVGSAEDAAVRLRPIAVTQNASQHDVRIARIDLHAADATYLLQSHQRPGIAGVEGFVDPLSYGDVAADERFTSPRPYDVRIARRHRQ